MKRIHCIYNNPNFQLYNLWWLWHNLLEALLSVISSINCQTEMSSETHEIEKKYVVLFVTYVFLYNLCKTLFILLAQFV